MNSSFMNVAQTFSRDEARPDGAVFSHRYPLPPRRGDDRKLHAGVQRAGPLRRLLDARASLPRTQDQEPPETLHLRALPGEREPGSPGERECQAGWRGAAPVAPSALPQCLFQQWSRRQSGLPLRGDAPERGLRVPNPLPVCPHSEKRNLPVRIIIVWLVHKWGKIRPLSEGETGCPLKPMPVFVGNYSLWLIQSLAWTLVFVIFLLKLLIY